MGIGNETQAREAADLLDLGKWALGVIILGIGVFGYHHYDNFPIAYRLLALIPVIGAGLLMIFLTNGGQSFWKLGKSAYGEIGKIAWPTTTEANQTTLIVVGVVFLAAMLLWLLDMLLNWLTSTAMG